MNIFTPYRTLDVHPRSSDEEIKAAHRTLSRKYHPDREGGDQSAFIEVQEAYNLIKDQRARSQLRIKLEGLGSPCTTCGKRGYTINMKKFVTTGIRACEDCDHCGFHPRSK